MTTLNELIKFCEEKGFTRCDFEYRDMPKGFDHKWCPRFFTEINPKEPENDGKLVVIQFDEYSKPSGKISNRVFIGLAGSSVKTNFEHLKLTDKGLEWWMFKKDVGLTESTTVLIER